VIALLSVAMAPPPPPPRRIASSVMTCAMNAVDGSHSRLSIRLVAESHLVNGREEPRYRWSIEGDDTRYPAPQVEVEMFSDEDVWADRSMINVVRNGYNFTYRLHYDGNYLGVSANRGHLLVERWRVGIGSSVEPTGIGLCTLTPIEVAQ
jgi:hypothetical protein